MADAKQRVWAHRRRGRRASSGLAASLSLAHLRGAPEGDIGVQARLSGWVHRVRDHGGLLFIDLRDHYGLTQVVADPDSPAFKIGRDACAPSG